MARFSIRAERRALYRMKVWDTNAEAFVSADDARTGIVENNSLFGGEQKGGMLRLMHPAYPGVSLLAPRCDVEEVVSGGTIILP